MIADKKTVKRISEAVKIGSKEFRVTGKTCDGPRWPEGNHFYVVDDMVEQKTYHVPVDDVDQDVFDKAITD